MDNIDLWIVYIGYMKLQSIEIEISSEVFCVWVYFGHGSRSKAVCERIQPNIVKPQRDATNRQAGYGYSPHLRHRFAASFRRSVCVWAEHACASIHKNHIRQIVMKWWLSTLQHGHILIYYEHAVFHALCSLAYALPLPFDVIGDWTKILSRQSTYAVKKQCEKNAVITFIFIYVVDLPLFIMSLIIFCVSTLDAVRSDRASLISDGWCAFKSFSDSMIELKSAITLL